MLTVYNDQDVDYTSYEGGTLAGTRAPGNGVIIASGPNPDNETYTVTLQPGAGRWKQLGLEVVQDESLPGLRVARGADRLVITELEVEAGGRKVPFVTGKSNLSNQASEYLPAGAIDGDPKTGWAINAYNETTQGVSRAALRAATGDGREYRADRAHPAGFGISPRHDGPVPPGALAERIFVADGRKGQRDSGRRAARAARGGREAH